MGVEDGVGGGFFGSARVVRHKGAEPPRAVSSPLPPRAEVHSPAVHPGSCVELAGLNFVEMFVWLSRSMEKVAQSRTDEPVALPPPGWTAV